jgi:exosortase family protein XrtF
LYLNSFDIKANEIDGFTEIVADQTRWLTEKMGYEVHIALHPEQPSVKFILNDVYISRIVEGCNALAVMILFMAFVIAFKGNIKKTIAFIALGIIAIHLLNIIRIALISIAIYHYPQYQHFLHGVLFPLVIYGFVFVLWVLWVKKYSSYATDTP